MGIPLTKEQALENLSIKFPNLDFSKFEFIDRYTHSTVICKKHGEFLSNYRLMYNKAFPCVNCKRDFIKQTNQITKEQALEKLKEKFPNTIIKDFDYNGYDTNITLICYKHNISVNKRYEDLVYKIKFYCDECLTDSYSKRNNYTTEYVLNFIKNKFPKYILFEDFVFVNVDHHFGMICPEHGEFETSFYKCKNNKNICLYCAKKKVFNPIEKLKIKYPKLDFSKFVYKNYNTKSTVICPIHGEFESSYDTLRYDTNINGCLKCSIEYKAKNKSLDQNTAIERLQEKFHNLDFSKFIYKTHRNKSIVICKKHGEFEISYGELIHYKERHIGCPKCSMAGYSLAEKEIVEFIKTFYNYKIEENNRNIILNEYSGHYLEIDIYLPDIKLAIEFNGIYWHSDESVSKRIGFNSIKEYHQYKTNKCEEQGIKLLHIDEQEWLNNKNSVLTFIEENIKGIIKNDRYNTR